MNVHVVPFTPAMVAAFERGKSQFRRHVVGGIPPEMPYRFMPGDLCMVAERWKPKPGLTEQQVRLPQEVLWAADDLDAAMCGNDWLPSLALPRSASRYTLQVQSVAYRQVQSITADECEREGVCEQWFSLDRPIYTVPGTLVAALTPREAYRALWIDLNGSEESWISNPWVWVVDVKLIRANVDVLLRAA